LHGIFAGASACIGAVSRSLITLALITHWTSAKHAPSDRPIEGSETAIMLESNLMRDETSDAVSRTRNFGDVLGASLVHPARHFGGSP
jgi:hypothetical protein